MAMNWPTLFVFIFSVLVEISASIQCPNSWIASDVVSKQCYLVISEKQNWFNADSHCKNLYSGSQLTSIGSAFENLNILTDVIDKTSSFSCDQLWIGAIDIEGSGNFTWSDGNPFQYHNWGTGQPDPKNQCVSQSRSTGKWITQQCSIDNCFICEYYLTSENPTSSTMKLTTQPITTSSTLRTSEIPTSSTTKTTTQPITTTQRMMPDCYDWRTIGGATTDGIYRINPPGIEPFDVWCDMTTDGGGWTVFQKRTDSSTNFWNRVWSEYKHGFNNGLDRNFWLGLDRINALSKKDANNVLRIDIFGNRCNQNLMPSGYKCDAFLGSHAYYFGEWPYFNVENENNKYRLHVSHTRAGNLSNNNMYDYFFAYSNDKLFSTIDNGDYKYCAADSFLGAFWYDSGCGFFALNGKYGNSPTFNEGFFVVRALDHPNDGSGWIYPLRSEMKMKKI